VEREACAIAALHATVGRVEVEPGASNVIAGVARASLDVRHRDDTIREQAVSRLLRCGEQIATRRGLAFANAAHLNQPAVPMDPGLTAALDRAVTASGRTAHRLTSGAGHDAMIVARVMPAAMLFLRSPGGISHHPDESVLAGDIAAALDAGMHFLEELA
jgi:allantoate deiminase